MLFRADPVPEFSVDYDGGRRLLALAVGLTALGELLGKTRFNEGVLHGAVFLCTLLAWAVCSLYLGWWAVSITE